MPLQGRQRGLWRISASQELGSRQISSYSAHTGHVSISDVKRDFSQCEQLTGQMFCSWNINYHKVTNKNKQYEFRRLYHDKQLFSNSMKPCENMTERNPYSEDLAPDHADTLRMGRAHMNAWKKTCIGKTFQTMSKHIWALIPLHKRKVCVDLRCQCWDFCPFIEKPSLAAVYVLN